MKTLTPVLFVLSQLICLPSLTAQITVRQGDGNVVFYRQRGFRGVTMVENEGVRNFGDTPIGNDQLRSVHVPPGFQVTLYRDAGFRGESVVLYHSERDLSRTSLGGGEASSAEVRWVGNAPQPITVFSEPGYRGTHEDYYESLDNFDGSYIGNDRISSIRVPTGVTVTLFQHAHFRGRSVVLRGDAPNLARTGLGVKEASSMQVDYPGLDLKIRAFAGVTLFDDYGFTGRRETIEGEDADLRDNRIGNDRVRSLRVPRGLSVTLYEHVDFAGRSETFSSSDDDLGDNRIGLDRVSSLRVFGRAQPAQQLDIEERPGVRIYRDSRFRGSNDLLYADVADLVQTQVGPGQISSLRVPPGYRVVLYAQPNFRGRSEVVDGDLKNLDGSRIGNDRARSLRIERTDRPVTRFRDRVERRTRERSRKRGIVLYAQPNYQGDHQTIFDNVANLKRHPFGNDRLFSIKVPRGCRVTLYRDSHFKGRSEVFDGNDPALGNNRIGAGQASSIKVEWLD